MPKVSKAWLRIRYRKSKKLSPFLQVEVHHFPSGDSEAQIIPPKTNKKDYRPRYGPRSFGPIRIKQPFEAYNSVFVIGKTETILEQLKQAIHDRFPYSVALKDITINYHKGSNGTSQE